MFVRCSKQPRGRHGVGIGFLILSLLHTPLPEPDYHNIRHHDAAGEVCEHHDHLLRWHPGAGTAQDVAILHWHWFLPASRLDSPAPADGPALHAHVPDWSATAWEHGPSLVPDRSTRLAGRLVSFPSLSAALMPAGMRPGDGHRPLPRPPLAAGAHLAPGVSLRSLLQRWVC